MKAYFKHYLKKNLGVFLFLTLLCVIAYVGPLLTMDYSYWNELGYFCYPFDYHPLPPLYLANISMAVFLMGVFLPILMFSYKMNKRSVDLYYSLPLSKRKILLVHFLVGLILLYVPYSAAYLLGFIVAAVKVQHIHLIYYLYMYFSSLIPAFVAYSVTAFIFTRANTVWDGIIAVAGVLFVLVMAVLIINVFSALLPDGIDEYVFYPFAPLTIAADKFEEAILKGKIISPFGVVDPPSEYLLNRNICLLVGTTVWTLISVAMTVALFLLEPRSRAENCGQISKSPFGCKILLPIYAFAFACPTIFEMNFLYLFIIAFAIYALAVVYKRRFWIGWKFAVVLLCSLLAGLGYGAITLLI